MRMWRRDGWQDHSRVILPREDWGWDRIYTLPLLLYFSLASRCQRCRLLILHWRPETYTHTTRFAALLLSVRPIDGRCLSSLPPSADAFALVAVALPPLFLHCVCGIRSLSFNLFPLSSFSRSFFFTPPYFSLSSSSIHLNVGVGGIDVCVHSSRIDLSTTIAWFSVWSWILNKKIVLLSLSFSASHFPFFFLFRFYLPSFSIGILKIELKSMSSWNLLSWILKL